MIRIRRLKEVFTPGRMPDVTYNPRSDLDVEGQLRRFLQNHGAAMTLSGPTKSGKTVVVERVLPQDEAVWIPGGDLTKLDDLWHRVIDFFELFDEIQVTTSAAESESAGGSGSLGVPGIAKLSGSLNSSDNYSYQVSTGAKRPLSSVARQALIDTEIPLVIDDFHYVPDPLKVQLIRAVKGLISHVPVVLIAVPSDAFRVVRDEPDMLGRLWQQEITPWSMDELVYIAQSGFRALNLVDEGDRLAKELAWNSLGAPFLMQQLCLDYCLEIGIQETVGPALKIEVPENLREFFEKIAKRYVPGVFDNLRRGPRTKGQTRRHRVLRDGRPTDIYGAVLYGLSRSGPVREIATQQLTKIIADHFEGSSTPNTQSVASALGHLNKIADANKGASDSALAYSDDILFIADPFLSFYLRYGGWDLPEPPEDSI